MQRRTTEAPCDPIFVERWSPRSFDTTPISAEQMKILLEASRWAPSAMNEQPWFFLVALSEEDRNLFKQCLVQENLIWAANAGALVLVLKRIHYTKTGTPNPTAEFDTGLATMSLILQAEKLGLATHPMGGFHREITIEKLGVDVTQYEPICFIAIGHRAPPEQLPERFRDREFPKGRKPQCEISQYGKFKP